MTENGSYFFLSSGCFLRTLTNKKKNLRQCSSNPVNFFSNLLTLGKMSRKTGNTTLNPHNQISNSTSNLTRTLQINIITIARMCVCACMSMRGVCYFFLSILSLVSIWHVSFTFNEIYQDLFILSLNWCYWNTYNPQGFETIVHQILESLDMQVISLGAKIILFFPFSSLQVSINMYIDLQTGCTKTYSAYPSTVALERENGQISFLVLQLSH